MDKFSDHVVKLDEAQELAQRAEVSLVIHCDEACNEWCACVESAAPAERFISKGFSNLGWALEQVIEHLQKLQP